MSEAPKYVNQPRCPNGSCAPWKFCKEEISVTTGAPFRKCVVCNNFVNAPACEGGCPSWADSASTSFQDSKGVERRKCTKCGNMVWPPRDPNAPPFKRQFVAPSQPPVSAETMTTTHIQIENLNARMAMAEMMIAQLKAQFASLGIQQ